MSADTLSKPDGVMMLQDANFPANIWTPMIAKMSQKIKQTNNTFAMAGMAWTKALTTTWRKHYVSISSLKQIVRRNLEWFRMWFSLNSYPHSLHSRHGSQGSQGSQGSHCLEGLNLPHTCCCRNQVNHWYLFKEFSLEISHIFSLEFKIGCYNLSRIRIGLRRR